MQFDAAGMPRYHQRPASFNWESCESIGGGVLVWDSKEGSE